jgi:hypothetical protein
MSEDKSGYKGDSVGKKASRIYLWTRILEHVRCNKVPGRIAYLASRDGGDASVLKGMGWPEKDQLAIDMDPGALKLFSEKYPNVPTALGSVEKVLASRNERFAAIYLDFCATGTNNTLDLIAACVPHVTTMGRVAYCLLRGRERGLKYQNMKNRSTSDRQQLQEALAAIGPEFAEAATEFLQRDQEMKEALDRLEDGRSNLFYDYLDKKLTSKRIFLRHRTSLVYHSASNDGQGVPMMIDDLEVDRFGQGTDLARFVRWKKRKYLEELAIIHTENVSRMRAVAAARQLELEMGEELTEPETPLLDTLLLRSGVSLDLHRCTLGNLVELSYQLEKEGYNPYQCLNVAKETLAAWRAHNTRGTYQEKRIIGG